MEINKERIAFQIPWVRFIKQSFLSILNWWINIYKDNLGIKHQSFKLKEYYNGNAHFKMYWEETLSRKSYLIQPTLGDRLKAKKKMPMKKHKIKIGNNYRNNGYLKMNEIVIKYKKWLEFSETHKLQN